MQLTIDEAAARLGKSARQIRYLIQNDGLPAKKIAGRWVIQADDLPLSEPQREAVGRQERALRGAVERGLMAAFSGLLRRLERRSHQTYP